MAGSGCLKEWLCDKWCDASCDALDGADIGCIADMEECGDVESGEGGDCSVAERCDADSNCYDGWLYLMGNVANQREPVELIDVYETCEVWGFIQLYAPTEANCSDGFIQFDTNKDGFISFWEGLQIIAGYLGMSQEKACQVDCSSCLQNPSLYF